MTGHLAKPSNPVRMFLMDVLRASEAKPFQDALKQALNSGPRVAGTTLLPWEHALIGTAFDYRARYSFAITPANKLVAALGVSKIPMYFVNEDDGGFELSMGCQKFTQDVDASITSLKPIARRLERTDEENLARHCVVLALLEQVARVGLRPGSPLLARPLACGTRELLELARPDWVADLREMAWLFDDCATRERLYGRPAVLNPTFAGSSDVHGADADLIVDGCLIEIKSTIQTTIREPVFHQLLGYVLLDYPDHYHINSIGVYLSRHGVLLKWPLAEALGERGEPAGLGTLRREFRRLLRSPLALSPA